MRRLALIGAVAGLALAAAAPAQAGVCSFPVQRAKAEHVKRGEIPPLAIGDSTMIYAVPALGRLGVQADAKLCRHVKGGLHIIRVLKRQRRLPDFVVLALGASDPLTEDEVDRALALIGPDRVLGLVTHRFFLGQPGADTELIRRVAAKHPNRIKLIDWVRRAAPHPGWFTYDGLHPNLTGAKEYARFIARAARQVRRATRTARSRASAPRTRGRTSR